MPSFDFSNYISPFTWRYGTKRMRYVFSEQHKYELWRTVWVSIAKAQHASGLLSDDELTDLEKNKNNIDIEEILQREKVTKHDVVAGIKEFAAKASIGGGKIHLGATSMDIVDNVEILRMKEALEIIEEEIKEVLKQLSQKIEQYATTPCLGYTHLQPAEPTTIGYRFAFYAQDLLMDFHLLQVIKQQFLKGKGIKGAVGTQASFSSLLKENGNPIQMEKEIMKTLGIEALDVSTQVYSRKIDYLVLVTLASIASSLGKFAGDLRILQSPTIGEWSEPFGEKQVGSSAMPFKKNPITAEKICSLSRLVAILPQTAIENATLSYLERTLDDSANRRIVTPESFLATDEMLTSAAKLLEGLQINTQRVSLNLSTYAPFIASEAILMKAVRAGANRQTMHEILREISLEAWNDIQRGKQNSMKERIISNLDVKKYISPDEIEKLFDVTTHVGTASERSLRIVKKINEILQ